MVGMLVGAMVDRAMEARQARRWREAFASALAAVIASAAIANFLLATPWGEDPVELARQAKIAMYREWKDDPDVRNPRIKEIKLERDSSDIYRGIVDATIDGRPERFELFVKVAGDRFFFRWEPLNA